MPGAASATAGCCRPARCASPRRGSGQSTSSSWPAKAPDPSRRAARPASRCAWCRARRSRSRPAAPVTTTATGAGAAGHEPATASRTLDSFCGRPVHAVAGIGDPARFFATLRAAGLEPVEHPFPDHHAFRAADLDFGDRNEVLMTSKDAVKCRAFADARMWEVPVRAEVEPGGGASLVTRVQQLQRAPRGAAGA
ncbi:MAG: tetraacyldisaccharide 4'-kinase [Steroidobacteraceae bacterium]